MTELQGVTMKILLLSIIYTAFLSANAIARKPAVEDFVGIETEGYDRTPKGTEVVFEFGNMVQAKASVSQPAPSSNILPGLMVLGFFSLPFLMWLGITRKTKQVTDSPKSQFEHIHTPNVTNLDDFRKTESESESNEEIKKAS